MKTKRQAGMTLVEVIVSVGILSTAILMFLVIINGASGLIKRGADLDTAGSASSQALEIFNDPTAVTSAEGNASLSNGSDTVAGTYRSVTIDDVTFTIFVPGAVGEDG